MTINVGDKVEYFNGGRACNKPFIGKTGVVTHIGFLDQFAILWDHECPENDYGRLKTACWSTHNFKPLIFKYDPKQAGDQDDDI